MKKFFCFGKNDFCENPIKCEGCEHFKSLGGERREAPKTNADHIRSLSDEELRIVLEILAKSDVCLNPQNAECDGCVFHPFCNSVRCEEDVVDWLKQPYKEV